MFIKALVVDFAGVENIEENMLEDIFVKLEETISDSFPDIAYDFSLKQCILYRNEYINNENISFSDYLEEGKMLKNFLIENNLATENNYKKFFSLEKRELDIYDSEIGQTNEQESQEERILLPSELDALIAPVDKNDPKLLEVLERIKKLKN